MGNPAFRISAGSDKADGPAVVYTGGLYGLFSRYLAERPFSQSLALQTFLSFFVSFFLSFVLGQTNKNQSGRSVVPGWLYGVHDTTAVNFQNSGRPAYKTPWQPGLVSFRRFR